jgi:hypothetical protein
LSRVAAAVERGEGAAAASDRRELPPQLLSTKKVLPLLQIAAAAV